MQVFVLGTFGFPAPEVGGVGVCGVATPDMTSRSTYHGLTTRRREVDRLYWQIHRFSDGKGPLFPVRR